MFTVIRKIITPSRRHVANPPYHYIILFAPYLVVYLPFAAMLSSVAVLTTSYVAPAGVVSSARSSVRMGVADMCAVALEAA